VTDLDLARIQGFVVRGYRLPFAGYIFLRILDAARAAAWLADITEHVLTAAPWSEKPESGVNIAFSYSGLRALALPDATLAGFPEDFRQGMAARATRGLSDQPCLGRFYRRLGYLSRLRPCRRRPATDHGNRFNRGRLAVLDPAPL